MAFAHSVQRVTISGTSFGGAEQWSTGFFVGAPGADASTPTQAFADAVRTAYQTFHTATTSQISNSWQARTIKVAHLGTDGKTLLDNTIFSEYGTPISGASSGAKFPPQVSVVATLMSDLSRGLGAKGRMYLPGIVAPVQSDGHFLTTDAAAMATNLKAFFDAVNTAAPVGSDVILASAGRGEAGDGKLNRIVTRVRIGNVYDTQRRRRNDLVETYSTSTLA